MSKKEGKPNQLSCRRARLSSALILLMTLASAVAAQEREIGLADVSTIYVASLGTTSAAESYRSLLAWQLVSVGFQVADRAEEAEATLSGIVMVKPRGKEPQLIFKTATLVLPTGRTLWSRKFRPTKSAQLQTKRIARSLRAGWKQAVWVAGRNKQE